VLVVHAAVIFVPLAALGILVTGWRKDWRKSYTFPLLLIALAGAAAAVIAAASGEDLEESIREAANQRVRFGDHPEEGETGRNFTLLFAFAVAAFWAIQQWGSRFQLKPWSQTAAYVVASGVGIIALTTIVIAGHSGAALVWKDVGNFVSQK
jgi:hypothetical protein